MASMRIDIPKIREILERGDNATVKALTSDFELKRTGFLSRILS
jgi:hypothetical protein